MVALSAAVTSGHQILQVLDNGIGKLRAGRVATHILCTDAIPDGVFQGRIDAASCDHHANVIQHPRGRSDDTRGVDDRFPAANHFPAALAMAVVVDAVTVVTHGAEHRHIWTVRDCGHRSRTTRHRAAHRAGESAVQAGREQHVVPARIRGHLEAKRVELLLVVFHVRVAGAYLSAGLHEHPVRQRHHVRLVKYRDPGVAVLACIVERQIGHVHRAFFRHRLDRLHDACVLIVLYNIVTARVSHR